MFYPLDYGNLGKTISGDKESMDFWLGSSGEINLWVSLSVLIRKS
jgi:inorganic pyrophosphatase